MHDHFTNMGPLEWTLAALAGLVAAWVIWLAVKYTLHPGEADRSHVKYSILDEGRGPGEAPPTPPVSPVPPTTPPRAG